MQGGLVRPAFAVLSAGILESTVNTETEKDRFMSENTKNPAAEEFLPVCKADMLARGWRDVDFVLVTGDAYVDHPSFGAAIIRVCWRPRVTAWAFFPSRISPPAKA